MDNIRAYRRDDESACLDVFDSNRPKYFTGPERALFAAYLQRLDEPFFVAEVEGQVRGCGGFHVNDYGVGYLVWGMVHGDWHRRGLGSNLLRWRLERMRQIAHAWCVLIDTSQHTAPFFARFGFESLRVLADGYEPGLDKVFMRLVWGRRPEERGPGNQPPTRTRNMKQSVTELPFNRFSASRRLPRGQGGNAVSWPQLARTAAAWVNAVSPACKSFVNGRRCDGRFGPSESAAGRSLKNSADSCPSPSPNVRAARRGDRREALRDLVAFD